MDSPRRMSGQEGTPNPVVPPQAVIDRSIIDSVAGFINDVGLNSTPPGDPNDTILWARFETADVNDPALAEDIDIEGSVAQPLLLVLGYVNGVQVWAIPANGEATEVLCWRHGTVKILRLLQTPKEIFDNPTSVKDQFESKRPLMAIVDSTGGAPQYSTLSVVPLRGGEAVKIIAFKHPILDVVANSRAVVVTFSERIAVFDSRTLDKIATVTTCYPSPGLSPNPISLGLRWLAYAERRLLPGKKSSGGCDSEGTSSYTATVLHAAKSLGKGLRGLGETVASSLSSSTIPRSAPNIGSPGSGGFGDGFQAGLVTVFDIQAKQDTSSADPIIAHFTAHQDAIAALCFDPSGVLLVTADKRGHDFHLFKIQPHPGGSSLAAVHHLYILHRGDTTAKIQDITFACDSRWIAVSSLRGTTHVFPITPYGGPVGIRTHGSPHVVNRLSRFHRSAGLAADGRSNSPVSLSEIPLTNPAVPYTNPRIPPFPHPTVIHPLAQIRQPMNLANSSSNGNSSTQRIICGRQRIPSYSEDSPHSMRVCATFATGRAYLLDTPVRDSSHKIQRKAVDSLFIMACHGAMLQYDLDPKHVIGIPKEKICDDTPIELEVEPKAQWLLLRQPFSADIKPPLAPSNWLLRERPRPPPLPEWSQDGKKPEAWLSQVEIVTHAGPHRRLWMGPQFMFKTYNSASTGSSLSLMEADSVEVSCSTRSRPARSNPVNISGLKTTGCPKVSVLIEAGSCSSYEQSPRLLTGILESHGGSTTSLTPSLDLQLKEDLADAMRESPGIPIRESGRPQTVIVSVSKSPNIPQDIDDHESIPSPQPAQTQPSPTVRMMVNAVGKMINLPPPESQKSEEDCEEFMHENCDEALFRPVVTGCNIAVKDTSKLFEDVSEDVCLRDRTIAVCITDHSEKKFTKKLDKTYNKPVEKPLENVPDPVQKVETSARKVSKKGSKNKSNEKHGLDKAKEKVRDTPREKTEEEPPQEEVIRCPEQKVLDELYEETLHHRSPSPITYNSTEYRNFDQMKERITTSAAPRRHRNARNKSIEKYEVEEDINVEFMEEITTESISNVEVIEDESSKRFDDGSGDIYVIERDAGLDDSVRYESIKPESNEKNLEKKHLTSNEFYEVSVKKAKTARKNKASKTNEYSYSKADAKVFMEYNVSEEVEENLSVPNFVENDSEAKSSSAYDERNLVVAMCDEPEHRASITKLEFQLDSEKILEMHDSFNDFAVSTDYGDQQDSDYKSLEVEIDDPYLSLEPCEFDDIQEKVKSDYSDYKNNDFVQIEQESVEGDKSSDSDSEKIKGRVPKRIEIIPMDTDEDNCVENNTKSGVDLENKPLPDVPSETKANGKKKSRKKRR